ncbi:S41 family peptidase [Agromyces binzhouensis]|uniref:Peptidase S41 n=1 Tax=Agromyces binzhouensis TaxID=1817495 RepID=A0A4Q2JIX9_9MICO|nr:S41 family peptidase [Agromyces binzhouensis]RXZ45990.1 peptidase S41 [Agromyces binzhouensis]
MPSINVIGMGRGHGLGAVRTMPEFRAHVEASPLSEAQRRTLVDQAEILIEGLYVHLPLKRAMHAVDPLQSLRLLRSRLPMLTEAEFHISLQRVFLGLRDLHTNYILPDRYVGFAFLGILVERCVEGGRPQWIVTKTFDHLTGDPDLVVGAEVTHWNGTPMAIAVERNAAREAGSNKAASLARGLENMTIRPVRMSLPPDEDWVDLTYRVGAAEHETRLPWRVFESSTDLGGGDASAELPTGISSPSSHLIGLDLKTELSRRVKRRLFAPSSLKEEARVERSALDVPRATKAQQEAGIVPTNRPTELKARTVSTASGTFGHLRIYTFFMEDRNIAAFIEEVARLAAVLPKDGLILDVRGNGGGFVIASEFLLQFFTPRRVRPEPMQFINTRLTADLCGRVADYRDWKPSIDESITTGAPFSRALPLYPEDVVNSVGQLYHGPVVLITDALCYSATDIFAAGFQDHAIGPVLGVDENTGAGGANVLTHEALRADWTGGPLRALPSGAAYRVSLRRCLRVGDRFGQPVEDLGVVPDESHQLTRRDVMEDNVDLMEAAGRLLAGGTVRVLGAAVGAPANGRVTLTLQTESIDSVDVYLDGRPVGTAVTPDGTTDLDVSVAGATPDSVLRLEGFDGDDLVASRLIAL